MSEENPKQQGEGEMGEGGERATPGEKLPPPGGGWQV